MKNKFNVGDMVTITLLDLDVSGEIVSIERIPKDIAESIKAGGGKLPKNMLCYKIALGDGLFMTTEEQFIKKLTPERTTDDQ